VTAPASEIAPETVKWPVPPMPPSVTSSLFKVSVDRTVILPVADVEVVALAECDDDPPHDASGPPTTRPPRQQPSTEIVP
jgi:hypothetical protein